MRQRPTLDSQSVLLTTGTLNIINKNVYRISKKNILFNIPVNIRLFCYQDLEGVHCYYWLKSDGKSTNFVAYKSNVLVKYYLSYTSSLSKRALSAVGDDRLTDVVSNFMQQKAPFHPAAPVVWRRRTNRQSGNQRCLKVKTSDWWWAANLKHHYVLVRQMTFVSRDDYYN